MIEIYKLGYSLGVGSNPKYSIKDRIKILLSVEMHAVELGYVVADRLDEVLDEEDIENIKKFKYISIHAPALVSEFTDRNVVMRYPSAAGEEVIEKIVKIAETVNADTILFHPDLVDDFFWLSKKIGRRLAFENMDIRKSFGKTVGDLEKVFNRAPEAKWVCDVNHIYTIDNSMELTDEFYNNFKDRLCHYHLSGYGGFHDCLYVTQEDVILRGIKNFSIPIIHEGRALIDGSASLLKENQYILNRLKD